MKDIRIDGRLARVFILKEDANSLVYIPVKALFRVDYDRLTEIEERGGEMLKEMQRTTLDNGINALKQYDKIIQVLKYSSSDKKVGTRYPKPEEEDLQADTQVAVKAATDKEAADQQATEKEIVKEAEAPATPARRKPGPRKGTKRTPPKTT